MTPPKPTGSAAQPAPAAPTAPAAQAAPATPAASAPVKAEAKLSANVQPTPPPPAKDSKKGEVKKEEKDPSIWKKISTYSLPFELGYGEENFQNSQGMDHDGLYWRIAPGLRLPVGKDGRFILAPRIFYQHQSLDKDLGEGVQSSASESTFGASFEAGYKVHPTWFTPYLGIEAGVAHYSADEPVMDMNTGVTKGGAEFNKNAMVLPLDDSGLHLGASLKLCTWNDFLCAGVRVFTNSGVNPKIDFVDQPAGGNPPIGFSPVGLQFGAAVDILRLIENSPSKKKPAPAATPARTAATPPVAAALAPAAATAPAAAPAPAKELSIADYVKITGESAEKAEKARKDNDKHLANSALAIKMDPPDMSTLRFYASDSIARSEEATAAAKSAIVAVDAIEKKIATLEGKEKTDAQAELKKAQANAAKASADADKAYTNAQKTHKNYADKMGAKNDLEFKAEQPPKYKAKGNVAAKPAAAPKAEAPKTEAAKTEAPKTEAAKKPDAPKTDASKPAKPAGAKGDNKPGEDFGF
jgi:hypothetical protein